MNQRTRRILLIFTEIPLLPVARFSRLLTPRKAHAKSCGSLTDFFHISPGLPIPGF